MQSTKEILTKILACSLLKNLHLFPLLTGNLPNRLGSPYLYWLIVWYVILTFFRPSNVTSHVTVKHAIISIILTFFLYPLGLYVCFGLYLLFDEEKREV